MKIKKKIYKWLDFIILPITNMNIIQKIFFGLYMSFLILGIIYLISIIINYNIVYPNDMNNLEKILFLINYTIFILFTFYFYRKSKYSYLR